MSDKKYFYGLGQRKNATARVRIFPSGAGKFSVNKKDLDKYFSSKYASHFINAPFRVSKLNEKFDISVLVNGGGESSQIEAIRLGITRALIEYDSGLKHLLRQTGFVTRDPRRKERKKPGLKRARRAPQWRKR